MAVAINATITFEHIARHLNDVTPEMIGKVHAIFVGSKKIYKVQSSIDTTKEYTVYRSKSRGYQCSCPSGQHGWWNVQHPSGVCWHVRAAVACRLEEKQALTEQASVPAPVVKVEYVTNVDAETLARIARRDAERKERKEKPARKVAYCQTRPAGFSLLKQA
jgi:hypothetical protein